MPRVLYAFSKNIFVRFKGLSELLKAFYTGREIHSGTYGVTQKIYASGTTDKVFAYKEFNKCIEPEDREFQMNKALRLCQGSLKILGVVKEKETVKGLVFENYSHSLREALDNYIFLKRPVPLEEVQYTIKQLL